MASRLDAGWSVFTQPSNRKHTKRNSYEIFINQKRETLSNLSRAPLDELMLKFGDEWQSQSSEQKKQYEELARQAGEDAKKACVMFIKDKRQMLSNLSKAPFQELMTKFDADWKLLSSEQKLQYKEIAKADTKKTVSQQAFFGGDGKLACTNQLLRNVTSKFEANGRGQQQKDIRASIFKRYNCVEEILKASVNFISMQVAIPRDDISDGNGHFSCVELAVAQFSVSGGIDKMYHDFPKPAPLVMGMKALAKAHAERTHRIDIYFENFNENYEDIWSQLDSLIGSYPDGSRMPVFCLKEEEEQVEYVLKWFDSMDYKRIGCGPDGNKRFQVLQLEPFVADLIQIILQSENRMDPEKIKLLLNSRDFWHCSDVVCHYHDNVEVYEFCTKTRVKTFAYMIGSILNHYNKEIIPASYVPALIGRPLFLAPLEDDNIPRVEPRDQEASTSQASPSGNLARFDMLDMANDLPNSPDSEHPMVLNKYSLPAGAASAMPRRTVGNVIINYRPA